MTVAYFMDYIFRIILVLGAFYMIINKIEGWGWLLFVALVTGLSTENAKQPIKNKNEDVV